MRFALIVASVISASLIVGCGGDEIAGPEERFLSDPVLILEHWILDDPAFERGELAVFEVLAGPCTLGCSPSEVREVYRTTLPGTGEVRLTLAIEDERCGYFAWPPTDQPDWKFPTLFLQYTGTWTGDRNQECDPGYARLNRLPCTKGPHFVTDFEGVQGCTPTGG